MHIWRKNGGKRIKKRADGMTMEWIRFVLGVGFLLIGVVTFLLEVFGVFKFKYVLD